MFHKPNSLVERIFGASSHVHTLVMYGVIVLLPLITVRYGYPIGMTIGLSPFFILGFIYIMEKPFFSFMILFLLNYFVIALMRYTYTEGLSVLVDIMAAVTFVSVLLQIIIYRDTPHIRLFKERLRWAFPILFAASLWSIYCFLEILNPTAMIEAWYLSRSLILYFLIIPLITILAFDSFKKVDIMLLVLAGLTLIGVLKGAMQLYMGFDTVETFVLNQGLYRTHLISSGTRYFSIFVGAGIFGPVMGHAMVVFGIAAFYVKSRWKKYLYILTFFGALYGLLISGTRGALAVPGAGFILFTLLSKQVRIMIPTALSMTFTYIFLAKTKIAQGVGVIRRMRTIFDPKEPSLMVRLENQKLFRAYLADKPFGEGLGLSGVDARTISERFTTSIPTDSWYVKIWVETGVVGLTIHIATFAFAILYGAYLLLFKVKDREIRGILTGLLCGTFGVLVSSYGNQILGQFPVAIITYMSFAIVTLGPYFDKQNEQTKTA